MLSNNIMYNIRKHDIVHLLLCDCLNAGLFNCVVSVEFVSSVV
jgi:hypothetical protein